MQFCYIHWCLYLLNFVWVKMYTRFINNMTQNFDTYFRKFTFIKVECDTSTVDPLGLILAFGHAHAWTC